MSAILSEKPTDPYTSQLTDHTTEKGRIYTCPESGKRFKAIPEDQKLCELGEKSLDGLRRLLAGFGCRKRHSSTFEHRNVTTEAVKQPEEEVTVLEIQDFKEQQTKEIQANIRNTEKSITEIKLTLSQQYEEFEEKRLELIAEKENLLKNLEANPEENDLLLRIEDIDHQLEVIVSDMTSLKDFKNNEEIMKLEEEKAMFIEKLAELAEEATIQSAHVMGKGKEPAE